MERVKVNGVELEYEVTRIGRARAADRQLIADCFLPLLTEPSLADRYQLIRYHKRGWVGSTHTPPPVSIGDHAADAAALLDHLGIPRAHIAGHSSGASIAAQLALDYAEKVHTLALLEPTLLSVPLGQAFLRSAGPVFEAYGSGDHAGAFAMFLSRKRARMGRRVGRCSRSGSPARSRSRSRTRTPSSASSCPRYRLDVRRRAGGHHPPASPVRAGCRDPASLGRGRRVPALLASARRGVHDRRRRSSPAHPASRARRSSDRGVPGAKPCLASAGPARSPASGRRHCVAAGVTLDPGKITKSNRESGRWL